MKKQWMLFFLVALSVSACASQTPQARDDKADAALGLTHEDQAHEAAQSLAEIQQEKINENQKNLQRQITDPLH
ncbi:MAG: hypothetical protein EXS63_06430 [Candidatus Omnitrophica bacterium]|nr:hypothetical protein [Candidatus Omnitrophota bacterium]